ncbi:MAG: TRAP transporter large permease subunit [Rhodospirillales bacterium]|nr:TRAP transporter large permease subunit [Rhodospirillales bacterium]
MNAVRSYSHTITSGLLVLYGLFVLPWIEATYAAILPVLIAVLLLLFAGRPYATGQPEATRWPALITDLLFLTIGIGVLLRLYSWTSRMDEGLTPLAVDGGPYFLAVIAGGIAVLVELTRRTFGWAGLGVVVAAAVLVALIWFQSETEFHADSVQAGIAGLFDSGPAGQILVVATMTMIAAVITVQLVMRSTLPKHLAVAAGWLFRGSRFSPVYLSLLIAVIVGSISGGASSSAMLAAIMIIPLFRWLNWPDTCAAALLLVAAYIPQVMPPITSASGITLAEITGISYLTIIAAMFSPALALCIGLFFILPRDEHIVLAGSASPLERVSWPAGLKSTLLVAGFLLSVIATWISSAILLGKGGVLFGFGAAAVFALVLGAWRGGDRRGPSLLEFSSGLGMKVASVLVFVLVYGTFIVSIQPLGLTLTDPSEISFLGIQLLTEIEHGIAFIFLTMLSALAVGLAGLPSLPGMLTGMLTLGPAAENFGLTSGQFGIFLLFLTSYSAVLLPAALTPIAAAKLADTKILGSAIKAYRWLLPTLMVPVALAVEPSLLSVLPGIDFSGPEFLWALARLLFSLWLLATVVSGRDTNALGFADRLVRFGFACALFLPDLGAQITTLVFGMTWGLYHRRHSRLSALPRPV